MRTVTSLELQRNVGRVQEMALQEPVAVTHHGRPRLVIMSTEQYDMLRRSQRRAYTLETMPRDVAEGIINASMDPKHDHLDKLVDEQ